MSIQAVFSIKNKYRLILYATFIFCSGCGLVRKSPSSELNDGYYNQKIGKQYDWVYVTVHEDTLRSYHVMYDLKTVDTSSPKPILNGKLINYSFDIDFLTIPVKYRPARKNVPVQLNANFTGALFLGLRTDKFRIQTVTLPQGKSSTNIRHIGFSIGLFSGFGNTAMNPTNTNNQILMEYDGMVWSRGIAGIIAINNFTAGICAGKDQLMGANRKLWNYNQQFWVGLAFGLNLN